MVRTGLGVIGHIGRKTYDILLEDDDDDDSIPARQVSVRLLFVMLYSSDHTQCLSVACFSSRYLLYFVVATGTSSSAADAA